MEKLIKIGEDLLERGIEISLEYDFTRKQFFLDLNTQAKSELHLYDDGILRGRYDYEYQMDLENENIFYLLLNEYSDAKYGRDFGNPDWEKYLNSGS